MIGVDTWLDSIDAALKLSEDCKYVYDRSQDSKPIKRQMEVKLSFVISFKNLSFFNEI